MANNQSKLAEIKSVVDKLDANKAQRFSYSWKAFEEDDIDGVAAFDVNDEQNIPVKEQTDYADMVLDNGVRAEGASIPRMAWNHFIGRFSYNINKLVQQVKAFLSASAAMWAHNGAEYDPDAHYACGDTCYYIEEKNGVRLYGKYIRVSSSPGTIQNIPPTAASHWSAMQDAVTTSSLVPFGSPGYRKKYDVCDLTGNSFNTALWYPVVTAPQDFDAPVNDNPEGVPQVLVEAYCNGPVHGYSNSQRAELSVLSRMTGFVSSSADITLNDSFTDAVSGAVHDVSASPIGYSRLVKGRQAVLWLRGGSRYAVWNSFGSVFTLHTGAYNNGVDDVIQPAGNRIFTVNAGTITGRLVTPDATRAMEAANLGQVNAAAIALQTGIQNEATSRENADIALQGNINAEATNRSNADTTHANLTNPHSATSAAAANRLMLRDANGRAQVASPSAAADIARKDTVDNAVSAEATARANGDTAVKGYVDGTGRGKGYLPLYAIYFQLPSQSAPSDLFGGTWTDITSSYAGSFFRALGGNAAAFGTQQGDAIRDITGRVTFEGHNNGGFWYTNYDNSALQFGGISPTGKVVDIYSGSGVGAGNYVSFSAASVVPTAAENRPINNAIKIFRRSA
jgi:hypothetical protein